MLFFSYEMMLNNFVLILTALYYGSTSAHTALNNRKHIFVTYPSVYSSLHIVIDMARNIAVQLLSEKIMEEVFVD